MKKLLILLFNLFLLAGLINGQDISVGFPVNQGNTGVPMNFSNGSPNITIPIFNAVSGDISLPIFLSYNSNGVQISKLETVLGTDWNLNVGGTITHIVNGLEDSRWGIASLENLDETDYKRIVEGRKDAETDVYLINLPGFSAEFVFDHANSEIIPLSVTDIVIEKPNNGSFKVSKDGISYYFEKITYTDYYKCCVDGEIHPVNTLRQWLLTRIVSKYTGHQITIEYTEPVSPPPNKLYTHGGYELLTYGVRFINRSTFFSEIGYGFYCDPVTPEEVKSALFLSTSLEIVKTNIRIEKVISDNSEIIFNYNKRYTTPSHSAIEDCIHPDVVFTNLKKLLSSVVISDRITGENLREFKLDYYHEDSKPIIPEIDRAFLYSVTETANGNAYPPYVFSYHDYENVVTSPVCIDFWGYANRYPAISLELEYRFPDEEYLKKGMLTQILNPSGSTTIYEYEPNTYKMSYGWSDTEWQSILNQFNKPTTGPGLRVKRITTIGNDTEYIKDIKYFKGRLSSYPIVQYDFEYNDTLIETFETYNDLSLVQPYITYEKVNVYDGGIQANLIPDPYSSGTFDYAGVNGHTEYEYKTSAFENANELNYDFPYKLNKFYKSFNGLPEKQTVKDNALYKRSETEYIYLLEETDFSVPGLKVISKNDENDDFYTGYFKYYQTNVKTTAVNTKTYEAETSKFSETSTNYQYTRGDITYPNPVLSSQFLSENECITTKYYYPQEFSGDNDVFGKMIERNILTPVIEKTVFNARFTPGKPIPETVQLNGKRTNYRFKINENNDTLIVPDNYQIFENGAYKTLTWFDEYDNKGNLLQSHGINGIYNSVIYGYDDTRIVANAVNAQNKQIFFTSFEEETGGDISEGDAKTGTKYYNGNFQFDLPQLFGIYKLSYWKKENNEWIYVEQEILNSGGTYTIQDSPTDEVRLHPVNAMMSTITYHPKFGKSSGTDANGITVYYDYDEFGRLIKISDQDRKLIKETEYYIKDNQ